MRPREGTPTKRSRRGGRRRSGEGHGAWRLAFALILVMIVTLVVAASASASPLSVEKVVTRDVSRASGVFPTPLMPWSPSAKGNGDIFYDGFEGPTSPWQVAGPSGTPKWGPTTYRAAAGSVSAYCAGSTIQAPGPYANNMEAWLWTGPVNLAGVTAATLEYQRYLVSEYQHDGIGVYLSLDDDSYYLATSWSGNSSGWKTDSIDLTAVPTLGNVCGQSTVYVAFIFTSDELTTYEGAYVDEVRITAGGAQLIDWTIAARPLTVKYNGTATVSGKLRDGTTGALLANTSAKLFWTEDASRPIWEWNSLGNYDSPSGEFAVPVPHIQRHTYFFWWFNGSSQYEYGFSDQVMVKARAKLSPPAFNKTVRRGVRVVAWGTLLPRHSATANRRGHIKVQFQRYSNGKYRPVATRPATAYRNTTSATKYKIVVSSFGEAGKWRARAIHDDSDHAVTKSSWRLFTVK